MTSYFLIKLKINLTISNDFLIKFKKKPSRRRVLFFITENYYN